MALTHFLWKGWAQPCSVHPIYNDSPYTFWSIASGVIPHASVYSTQLDSDLGGQRYFFSLSSQHGQNIGLGIKCLLHVTNICANLFSSLSNDHVGVFTLWLQPCAFGHPHRTQLWAFPLFQIRESVDKAGQHRDFKTPSATFPKARSILKLLPARDSLCSHHW